MVSVSRSLQALADVGRIVRVDMRAVAIKKGQVGERPPMASPREMGIVRCDGCGEEFVLYHNPVSIDKSLAERQAHWLEKVLADEHERECKHPDRIQLPE